MGTCISDSLPDEIPWSFVFSPCSATVALAQWTPSPNCHSGAFTQAGGSTGGTRRRRRTVLYSTTSSTTPQPEAASGPATGAAAVPPVAVE